MAAGKKRIYLLDELRGLAVFCMVFYHAFYSMSEFFNIAIGTKLLDFFTPAEPFFAALFIVISGISSRLSHNNTKRGVRLLCVALALTVVTAVIMPMMHFEGAEIYFGILHLLSLSMLIFSALRAGLDKINPIVGIIVCIAIYIFTYGVSAGYVGIAGLKTFDLPRRALQNQLLHAARIFQLLVPFGGLFSAAAASVYVPDRHIRRCICDERQIPRVHLSPALKGFVFSRTPRARDIHSPSADHLRHTLGC